MEGQSEDFSNGVDRLSSLPDSLLYYIVSFLPTKDAVATSMLSTQWKRIFPSIPNLKLNFDDKNMSTDRFESFVNKVLHVDLRNATCICAMRISCTREHWPHIKTWMSAAARLRVESLDLKFKIRQPHWFSNEISRCSQLTTLKLTNSPLYAPCTFCLPNLKFLELRQVGFFKECTAVNLLNGCAMLGELIMIGCKVYAQTLHINCSSLKCLTLQDLTFLVDGDAFEEIYDFEIEINTPDLQELNYNDYHVAPRYNVGDLTSLRKAWLDIKPDADQEQEDSMGYSVNVAELVTMCSMVKCLYLSARTLQAVYCSHRGLISFPNLSHLELQLNVVCPRIWKLVTYMLDCASNLTSLVVEMGIKKSGACGNCKIDTGGWIPDCLALHIRKITVSSFTGVEQELALLIFFLKHGKYLEDVVVVVDSDLKTEEQLFIKEMLLKLPHTSNDCQIVIKTSVGAE